MFRRIVVPLKHHDPLAQWQHHISKDLCHWRHYCEDLKPHSCAYLLLGAWRQQRWGFFSLWMFTIICWQSDTGIVLFWTRNITGILKVKIKCSRYRPSVAQRVGRGIALLFHDCGTRRGWVVSSTPRPHFTPGKTQYPFYRRLGGPQQSGWAE